MLRTRILVKSIGVIQWTCRDLFIIIMNWRCRYREKIIHLVAEIVHNFNLLTL